MVKLIFRIIALIVLIVGFIFVIFGGQFVPENKYSKPVLERKKTKIKLIGFIICLFSALIFLIVSLF